MAGDAHVSRLLTPLALALACSFGWACGSPAPHADAPPTRVSTDLPSKQQRPTTAEEPGEPSPDTSVDDEAVARGAWARLRWPGATVVEANRTERLHEAVHAGSIFKLLVARAALAQGIVTSATRIACPRALTVHGRRVDCVHPDLGRPLSLDDALAHSCNHFFVRVAERLDRQRLDAMVKVLSRGAVAMGPDAPLPLVVLGLEGPRAGMLTWARVALEAMTREDDTNGEAAIVRRGAARAVTEGTAQALHDASTLTLAKTGTTVAAGSGQEGRVVAWRPERGEVIVIRAPGVPGRDAARLARAIWDRDPGDGPVVRVGRIRTASSDDPPAIARVPLERYVAGVVAAEAETGMPSAALDALAVAVRSYAQAPNRRHARDGFDVCDTTHCQVLGEPTSWSRAAATRTRGIVLGRGTEPVAVPYSASCGGLLIAPRDIWGGRDAPITRTGPDPAGHPVDRWEGRADSHALLAALQQAGHRGDTLRDVRISARTPDGVPTRVALDGLMPDDLDAATFRHIVGRRLGWDILKSHAWDGERTGRGYRFTGRGKGHGAGLCVRGAALLASRGSSMSQLLAIYVPGARPRAVQDRVTLRVPALLTSQATRLRDGIQALMAELRASLAVSSARDVDVVVHPTREAYQRATGRAWWTTASSRRVSGDRYRIDVAPPARPDRTASEAAEDLLPTLKHEVVHVLTQPALDLGPAWAAEGLAHLISRPQAAESAAERPSTCPSDTDVVRPGGAAAMQEAYSRAAACVSSALPQGLDAWRTLAFH